MAAVTRTPRSRGAMTGVLLVLLGVWGGLVPFIGPYFHYAYTPDKALAYTTGRLYLSIVPGAAALLGGLLVLGTRSRGVGVFGGLLAVLGGAWFIVGASFTAVVLKRPSISPGIPVGISATRTFSEQLGFFVGLGILIVFLAAIAMGRFSLVGVKDAALADDSLLVDGGYPAAPGDHVPAADQDRTVTTYPYSAGGGQYQGSGAAGQYQGAAGQYQGGGGQYQGTGGDYQGGGGQYQGTGGDYQGGGGQYQQPDPGAPTRQYPPSSG
jgi:hypothetical protein